MQQNVSRKPRQETNCGLHSESVFSTEVLTGLTSTPKTLLPKYFYDEQGSRYYEEICALDEYYPFRTEIALLPDIAAEIAGLFSGDIAVIEFGAGSLQKIRPLFAQLPNVRKFVPIDISGEHLRACSQTLQREYPHIQVLPIEADFSRTVEIAPMEENYLGFFPGSTIGNFDKADARQFLKTAKSTLGANSNLLIGVDTKKSPTLLHRAYNDAQGVTAKFNLNILTRINRELNADFNLDNFAHAAHYNSNEGRIEMHLTSLKNQRVIIDGLPVDFDKGETIHTENSYKYTPAEFSRLAGEAGWNTQRIWLAPDDMFSVFLLSSGDD